MKRLQKALVLLLVFALLLGAVSCTCRRNGQESESALEPDQSVTENGASSDEEPSGSEEPETEDSADKERSSEEESGTEDVSGTESGAESSSADESRSETSEESASESESGSITESSSENAVESETETQTESETEKSTEPATASANEWYYPMSTLAMAEGTVAIADNVYKIVKGYNGALISLAGIAYDSVEIVRGTAPQIGYSFFAQAPIVNQSPSYARGYTRVIWTSEDVVRAVIPANAAYLYVYYQSAPNRYVPQSIRFYQANANRDPKAWNEFTIATWNIGHFSGGKKPTSSISGSDAPAKQAEYRDFIENAVRADVFSLNEYSAVFAPGYAARSALFGSYPAGFEGAMYHYSCNALYSKVQIANIEQHAFDCNATATITHTNLIEASDYYYITADLTVAGKTVKLVSAHLGFDKNLNPDTVNLNQIDELIAKFRNEERVIILGDFNAKSFDYLRRFEQAGFGLANPDASLYTFISSKSSLDNIIVKGVGVSRVTLHGTNLSDHYALSCTITVP